MKINKVIRKYRKLGNLTQEQIANYLGVTAPAVNKWENGNSYPDITLLAPLARILKIDVDTLLSFHEDLSDTEINQLLKELSESIHNDGYDTGFKKGEALIKEYPNCDKLRLHTAEILNAYLRMKGIENPENYESKIIGWFEVVLTSQNEKVVEMAKSSLVSYYMNKGEYDKSQQLLDDIEPIGFDKRLTQAILFERQSRNEEAYEIYENMLYKDGNQINSVLQLICHLLCQEKKYADAERYANLAKEIALLLDMGEYTAYTPNLLLAVEQKDVEQSIKMLEHMIDGIETFGAYQDSNLYSHIRFNKNAEYNSIKKMLKASLKSAELDFLRKEPAAQKLFRRLET